MAFQAPQVLQPSEGDRMSASQIASGCAAARVDPPGAGCVWSTEQTGLLCLGPVPLQNIGKEGGEKERKFLLWLKRLVTLNSFISAFVSISFFFFFDFHFRANQVEYFKIQHKESLQAVICHSEFAKYPTNNVL